MKVSFCLVAAGALATLFSKQVLAETPREIRIGLMAELSGPFTSLGEECTRGYKIAQAMHSDNGKVGNYLIKPIYGDHQRDAKAGINEFNRIVNQEHAIGIVTNASSVAMALNPLSQQKKIPMAGSVAHPKFIPGNQYAFRFWINAIVEGEALAQKAIQMGKKTVAVVTLEEDYPLAVSEGFTQAFKKLGGEIVFDDRVIRTEVDFNALLTRIRALKPDLIFVNIVGDQLPLILKKVREQGIKQQLFSSFSMSNKDYLKAIGQENSEDTIYLEVNGEAPKFNQKLNEMFGATLPTGLNYTCYAGYAFLIEALKRNPDIVNSDDLYHTLLSMNEISTPDGPLPMKNREAQLHYVFRTIHKGQPVDLT